MVLTRVLLLLLMWANANCIAVAPATEAGQARAYAPGPHDEPESSAAEPDEPDEPDETAITVDDSMFAGRIFLRVAPHNPQVGPSDALVTIIVFSDYGCPYCGLTDVRLRHANEHHPADLRLVFRQFPREFDEQAEFAARASLAADRQHQFAAFNRAIHARRGEISGYAMYAIARELRLDGDQFRRDVQDPVIVAAVRQDSHVGDGLGIPGTPSFLVNGRLIVGTQTSEAIETVIAEEIELAQRLLTGGVARGDLFEHILDRIAP